MAKSQKKTTVGVTIPSQFRLRADTLTDLDAIAREHGLSSRADAIRFAARTVAKKISGNPEKLSKSS